jgi:hypothetical protein
MTSNAAASSSMKRSETVDRCSRHQSSIARICESASGVVLTVRFTVGGAVRPGSPQRDGAGLPGRISMTPTARRVARGVRRRQDRRPRHPLPARSPFPRAASWARPAPGGRFGHALGEGSYGYSTGFQQVQQAAAKSDRFAAARTFRGTPRRTVPAQGQGDTVRNGQSRWEQNAEKRCRERILFPKRPPKNLHPKRGNTVGTEPPKHGEKRGIRADQHARRVNNIHRHGPACKTSIPGSNPRGASTLRSCFRRRVPPVARKRGGGLSVFLYSMTARVAGHPYVPDPASTPRCVARYRRRLESASHTRRGQARMLNASAICVWVRPLCPLHSSLARPCRARPAGMFPLQ